MPRASESVDHLVGISSGHFSAELVDLADAVPASPATTDQNTVLIIRLDADESRKIGGVSIHGKDTRADLDAALSTRSFVNTGKFISNAAAGLPQSDHYQLH